MPYGQQTSEEGLPGTTPINGQVPTTARTLNYPAWKANIANNIIYNLNSGNPSVNGAPGGWNSAKYGDWSILQQHAASTGGLTAGDVTKLMDFIGTGGMDADAVALGWGAPPAKTASDYMETPEAAAARLAQENWDKSYNLNVRQQQFAEQKFAIQMALDNASRQASSGGGGGGSRGGGISVSGAGLDPTTQLKLQHQLELETLQKQLDFTALQNAADRALQREQLAQNQKQYESTLAFQRDQAAADQAYRDSQLKMQKGDTIAKLSANPNDWVQRDYTLRGWGEPSGQAMDAFTGDQIKPGQLQTFSQVAAQNATNIPAAAPPTGGLNAQGLGTNANSGATNPGYPQPPVPQPPVTQPEPPVPGAAQGYGSSTARMAVLGDRVGRGRTGYEELLLNPTGAPFVVIPNHDLPPMKKLPDGDWHVRGMAWGSDGSNKWSGPDVPGWQGKQGSSGGGTASGGVMIGDRPQYAPLPDSPGTIVPTTSSAEPPPPQQYGRQPDGSFIVRPPHVSYNPDANPRYTMSSMVTNPYAVQYTVDGKPIQGSGYQRQQNPEEAQGYLQRDVTLPNGQKMKEWFDPRTGESKGLLGGVPEGATQSIDPTKNGYVSPLPQKQFNPEEPAPSKTDANGVTTDNGSGPLPGGKAYNTIDQGGKATVKDLTGADIPMAIIDTSRAKNGYSPVTVAGGVRTTDGGGFLTLDPGDYQGPPDGSGNPTYYTWDASMQKYVPKAWTPTIISTPEQFNALPDAVKQRIMNGYPTGYQINDNGYDQRATGGRYQPGGWFNNLMNRGTASQSPGQVGIHAFNALPIDQQRALVTGQQGVAGAGRNTGFTAGGLPTTSGWTPYPTGTDEQGNATSVNYVPFTNGLSQVSNLPTDWQPYDYSSYFRGSPQRGDQLRTIMGLPTTADVQAEAERAIRESQRRTNSGGGYNGNVTPPGINGDNTGNTGNTGSGGGAAPPAAGGGATAPAAGGSAGSSASGSTQTGATNGDPSYGVISYGPDVIQNAPSLQLLMGAIQPDQYGTLGQQRTYVPALKVWLPAPGELNYGAMALIKTQNPAGWDGLKSLFASGNRDLESEMATAASFAPNGSAYQSTLVQT